MFIHTRSIVLFFFLPIFVYATTECGNFFDKIYYQNFILEDVAEYEVWAYNVIEQKTGSELKQAIQGFIYSWNKQTEGIKLPTQPEELASNVSSRLYESVLLILKERLQALEKVKEELQKTTPDLTFVRALIIDYQDTFWSQTLLKELRNRVKSSDTADFWNYF